VVLDTLQLGEPLTELAPGMYVGTLVNNLGCAIIDTMIVNTKKETCLVIPNLVTANGDGFNDVFKVQDGCEYDAFQVLLYTDMGKQIFDSDDCNFIWDPKAEGIITSSTVYYYYIRVTEAERVFEFKGSLNINL
jgi:gliding motility-associated-like protein